MLRAAAASALRHVRTPWLGGGVRRFCSSSEGVASLNPNPDGCCFYSETEARELFETWCKKYGKTYSSEEEKLFRFGLFRETLEWCIRKNQKHELGFNPYSHADQTEEECLSAEVEPES